MKTSSHPLYFDEDKHCGAILFTLENKFPDVFVVQNLKRGTNLDNWDSSLGGDGKV